MPESSRICGLATPPADRMVSRPLAWTILPYWTTNAFYAVSPFLARDRRELDTLGLRLLSDLGLSPDTAIGSYLPAGWTLDEAGEQRTLAHRGETVATVHRTGAHDARLENRREGYRLHISSVPVQP